MPRKNSARKVQALRSNERLVFAYHQKDSPNGVKRDTVKRLASQLNISETRFLHLGAALLVRELNKKVRSSREEHYEPVTDRELAALRQRFPQDQELGASVLDFLDEDR